jgi:hypothetical protein
MKPDMLTQVSDLITAANVGIMLFFFSGRSAHHFHGVATRVVGRLSAQILSQIFFVSGHYQHHRRSIAQLAVGTNMLGPVRGVFLFQCFLADTAHQPGTGQQADEKFNLLHYTSVGLSLVQLVVMIWIVVKSDLAD